MHCRNIVVYHKKNEMWSQEECYIKNNTGEIMNEIDFEVLQEIAAEEDAICMMNRIALKIPLLSKILSKKVF